MGQIEMMNEVRALSQRFFLGQLYAMLGKKQVLVTLDVLRFGSGQFELHNAGKQLKGCSLFVRSNRIVEHLPRFLH